MSRAFCLVCGAHEVRSPPQVFTQNISYSVVYVSTLMAILTMGKYANIKIEYYIIPQVNGFVNRLLENFLKWFSEIVCQVAKVQKESRYRGVAITL